MGVMVSEVYDALIDAGAEEAKARAAAESIPISEHLATKQDIAALEAKMWRLAITVASLAVVLSKFLDEVAAALWT